MSCPRHLLLTERGSFSEFALQKEKLHYIKNCKTCKKVIITSFLTVGYNMAKKGDTKKGTESITGIYQILFKDDRSITDTNEVSVERQWVR